MFLPKDYQYRIIQYSHTLKNKSVINAVRLLITSVIISILIFIVSCEKESFGVFHIEISDGTVITEDDILYYDSSTCILFLNEKIYLSYREPESGRSFRNEFSVFVDGDKIYSGLIYPEEILSCAGPPRTYIIQRDEGVLDRSVMEIAFEGDPPDQRNDPRIIDALNNDGLLNSGISFTLDNVEVLGRFTDDTVCCTITLLNHDYINYYVLDPQRMGEDYYNYYNGGLVLIRHESGYRPDCCGIYQSEYGTITEEDLTVLEAKKSLTFTFCSDDYFIGFDGIYKGILTLRYRSSHLDLNQPNGRIWIGRVSSSIDNINIELMKPITK